MAGRSEPRVSGLSAPLLHVCFDEQAGRTPDRVALYHEDRSITYAALQSNANRVAHLLRSRGLERPIVGLHVERSIDYVIGVLGILKAGGAVVPLPPSYPEARLREVLSFAGFDAVLDHCETPLPAGSTTNAVRLPDLTTGGTPAPGEPPATAGDPDAAAFVLCSSGSTGTPKMIVRSHRSFFHRLTWTWANHPYASGETCAQKSFMTTTHAIYELFEPLLRGAATVVFSDEKARDLVSFWDAVAARGISRLLIVPSVLQASLAMPELVAPPLRVIVLMGEYVSAGLAEKALAAFPSARIYSIYGSTEASSTLVCDLGASFRPGHELPLGTPIAADVQASVLGEDGNGVARGEVGRLHMSGPALFTEYFKNPEHTAAVLARTPDGGLRYDTHDQVRVTANGDLEYVGRVDHTVKIRGFRVDLQEVERALLLQPEVSQGAVVVSDDGAGAPMLLAYYSPASLDHASVYRGLRERLPAYMVPSVLVGLDSFPRTAGGKIDRRALSEHTSRPTGRGPAHAWSETERAVLDAWADVLMHSDIGPTDSFFEVGGTSLSVFRLLHRLRKAIALDRTQLSDQAVYQFPTIAQLAARIDSLKRGDASPAPAAGAILATLKKAADPSLAPFFLISSAGGTLGAYQKLARALTAGREVVGVRDPYVWGERDPRIGFGDWVGLYLGAIRERQPHGPYYVGAYSSGGAFGYEIARRLRRSGETVALLALLDPVGTDSRTKARFGHWAFSKRRAHPLVRRMILAAGRLRSMLGWGIGRGADAVDNGTLTESEFRALSTRAKANKHHILGFSALLELNTELPLALDRTALAAVQPEGYLGVLLAKVKSVAPEVDPQSIENMVVQYYLQTRARRDYRLRRYDGTLVLVEPDGPHRGLMAELFRAYVRELRAYYLASQPSAARGALGEYFGPSLGFHYVSMRDDDYVAKLARVLDALLAG